MQVNLVGCLAHSGTVDVMNAKGCVSYIESGIVMYLYAFIAIYFQCKLAYGGNCVHHMHAAYTP